jgi:hypothetical protein
LARLGLSLKLAEAAADNPQGTPSERVNLRRARELLADRGDRVEQSTLSRYASKYADALDPQRDGRELTINFEALIQHRSENINRAASAPSSSPASVSISKGRAHEASLNIRAQRQIRELDIAERIGALTPTSEVRAAAAEAMSALRNAFALSLNDSASGIAHAFNLEARLVRRHLKAFEKAGLEAFARALEKDLVAEPDGIVDA